jgi:uncharacterized protein (DUF1330 family)
MKTHYVAASSVFVGIAIGAVAVQTLHAQAKPPGYLVAEVEVTDPPTYQTYIKGTNAIAARYGSKFIVRGGKTVALAGEPPQRVAISIFDSLDKAVAFQNDPEYKALIPIRDKSSKYRSYAVEGAD